MSKNRITFTAAGKLVIINEADQNGVTPTLRKHNLSHSVFRRWRDQFNEGGVSPLKSYSRERNPELDEAKEQLRLLKSAVAPLQMELEFKDELLKKLLNSCPGCRRGSSGF
jgi:putative transposase